MIDLNVHTMPMIDVVGGAKPLPYDIYANICLLWDKTRPPEERKNLFRVVIFYEAASFLAYSPIQLCQAVNNFYFTSQLSIA